jgi:DNA-binding CsgD family transcriptional regulator
MLSDVPPTSRSYWHTVLVNSYLATGELQVASEIVELMDWIESELGPLLHPGEVAHARASIQFARGQYSSAAREAAEATRLYAATETYVDAARTRLLAGRALVASGSTTAGEHEIARAHRELVDRGAARLADQAARELRSLGRTVSQRSKPRATASGVESLSDRELDVAERVAQGYTNREIAHQLFVSPKTVEAHLARVYGKLGVKSRAAMVAVLTRSQERDR